MRMLDSLRGRTAAGLFVPFALALVAGSVLPGALPAQRIDAVTQTYQAPPALCSQFDVMAATVQHLDQAVVENGERAVRVELGGQVVDIALQLHELRAADFRLLVRDDSGIHELPRPACVTYRGSVLQDQDSWVRATIEGASITAMIRRGNGDTWIVQPVRSVQPQAGAALHVVYRQADNASLPWQCGTPGTLAGPVPAPVQFDVTRECEIACEADFQYYQQNGSSTTNTQNDVTGVINAVEAIYLADVQVAYTISTILINTSSATNPYTSSVAGTLLGQFASNWVSTHGGIHRDVAHLFTGRPMGQTSGGAIGIAYLNGMCSGQTGYGVSQSRWTGNFSLRVAVTAHEIGHNFSAQHCDAVPPCNIMCSGAGGCSGNVSTFSQNERNQINAFIGSGSAGCLAVLPGQPAITSLSPTTVTTFLPGTVTVTGTGMLGVTQVQVGTATVTAGLSTPDDQTLRFNPPPGLAIGLTAVTVTNSTGTSNGAGLLVQATDPCRMSVNGAVLGGSSIVWSMGGGPNDVWVVIVGLANSTSLFQGWPVLDNQLVLGFGALDPANGMSSFSVPVPAATFSGLRIYSQMVELLPTATLTVDSTSTVGSTLIFN